MRPRTTRSSSPRISPEMRVSGPITVSLSAMARLHVHVDGAGEARAFFDHQPRRADVADDPCSGMQDRGPAGDDVAADLTFECRVRHLEISLDAARLFYRQTILQRHAPLDASFDDQVL